MKLWSLALFAHFLILAIGIGFMGEGFTDLTILYASIVNLLLWTGLISLAGLAAGLILACLASLLASAAARPMAR